MELYEYMVSLGYNNQEIMKIKNYGVLSSYQQETLYLKIKSIFEVLLDFGYEHEDILMMTKKYPLIYSFTAGTISEKIKGLLSLGYSKEQIIKMTKKCPSIYSLSLSNMKIRVEKMVELGFSLKQVKEMLSNEPVIYNYSMDSIKKKMDDLGSLGYQDEEKLEMIVKFPQIYGLSIENIKRKKEFYDSISLGDILIINPKYIMQSVELSYARYMFYKSIGINVDMSNYICLFWRQKYFIERFGRDNQGLLMEYNYDKYLEEKELDTNARGKVLV